MIAQQYQLVQIVFFNSDILKGETPWGLNFFVFVQLFFVAILLQISIPVASIVMLPWLALSLVLIPSITLFQVLFMDLDITKASIDYDIIQEYDSFEFPDYYEEYPLDYDYEDYPGM